jgi:hypothetical protein
MMIAAESSALLYDCASFFFPTAQLNEKAFAETPLEESTEAALRFQGRGCNP